MPESNTAAEPVVYQLRVVLRGVSPLIWRRLLVRSETSIAEFHRTLQVAFGWSDEHLHRFVIHGRMHSAEASSTRARCNWPISDFASVSTSEDVKPGNLVIRSPRHVTARIGGR